MNKIIIIGCPGSGKSTFAKKLSKALGLTLFHLDSIWHKPDRTHISREEFDNRLDQIMQGDKWIIDGNYSRTLERRIEGCDTVFFFDLSTETCLQGAKERVGKQRSDMPWFDTTLSAELENEILSFRENTRPIIYSIIEKQRGIKSIFIFTDRKQADDFILQII